MTREQQLIKSTIEAWEALPGGQQQSVRDVERWLIKNMQPAINALRAYMKEENSNGQG